MQDPAPHLPYTFQHPRQWGPWPRQFLLPYRHWNKNGELKEKAEKAPKIIANRNRSLGRSCIQSARLKCMLRNRTFLQMWRFNNDQSHQFA